MEKDQLVIKSAPVLKKLCILLFSALLLSNICMAQNGNDSVLVKRFEDSFTLRVLHPSGLLLKCTPVICMLKITINDKGKVAEVMLSDSADPLFRAEYEKNKAKIEFQSIEKYCSNLSLKNTMLVIPLAYFPSKTMCQSPLIDPGLLLKYDKFKGEYLRGEAIFLPSIVIYSVLHDY